MLHFENYSVYEAEIAQFTFWWNQNGKNQLSKRRWLISHTILFEQRVNWYRCKSGSLKKQDFKMVFFYWTLKYSSTKKLNEKRSNNDRYNTLVLGSLLLLFFAYNIFCHVKFGMVEEKQKFENICPIIILQILKWLGSILLR